jgi:hypothetical protein
MNKKCKNYFNNMAILTFIKSILLVLQGHETRLETLMLKKKRNSIFDTRHHNLFAWTKFCN